VAELLNENKPIFDEAKLVSALQSEVP